MSKREPRPIVKQWVWMTPEEQIEHLMQSHGFRDGYFTEEDDTPWSDGRTKEHFEDFDVREEYHDEDHREYKWGGGKEHEHALYHPGEVEAAIASIKETIHARR